MGFEIRPHTGVGEIDFGMTPSDIRGLMHEEPVAVDKSDSGIPADSFQDLGILVYYKQPGLCEAVEFFGPVSPIFAGQHLLGRPYAEAERWLKSLDPHLIYHDAGLITKKHGLALYAPSAHKNPAMPVKAVLAFEPGYYER
jgi:hypothetical protein